MSSALAHPWLLWLLPHILLRHPMPKNLTTYNLKIATPNRTAKPKKDGKTHAKWQNSDLWSSGGGSKHDPSAGGKTEFQGKAARRDGAPRWRHDVGSSAPCQTKMCRSCTNTHRQAAKFQTCLENWWFSTIVCLGGCKLKSAMA